MIALAIWFLQMCFPALYREVRKRRISLRITCWLATASSVLTSDPLFHSLLLNATALAHPKAKRHKKGTPKAPPTKSFPIATKPTLTRDTIMIVLARVMGRRGGIR